MCGIDCACGRSGRRHGEQCASGNTESLFLALHHRAGRLCRQSVCVRLEAPHECEHHAPDRRHHTEQCQPLATVAHERPVGAGQAYRNDEDRKDFHDVAQRRRILEWVRRIRRKGSAAVGAEFLDRFLRGERPDHTLRMLTRHRREPETAVPRLHHTLSEQDRRDDHTERQKDSDTGASQIDPEVADQPVTASIHQSPDQCDRHCHPDRSRHEILHREAEHLREIAHHGLGRVRLPVGVRDE